MFLSRISVQRPVMMTMVVGVFVVFGLVASKQMPVELLPRFDLPYIMVTIVYPGAGPEDVESALLVPIEEALGKVNRVTSIRTSAVPDAALAILQLEMDTDTDKAVANIRSELEKIDRQVELALTRAAKTDGRRSVRKRRPNARRLNEISLADALEKVFRTRKRPVHYKDLTELVVKRGLYRTRSKNLLSTVAVTLKRDRRFKKVEPGMYTLR